MPLIDPIDLKAKLADFVSGIPTGFHCRLLQQKNSDRKRSATTKIRCNKIKIWQQRRQKKGQDYAFRKKVAAVFEGGKTKEGELKQI